MATLPKRVTIEAGRYYSNADGMRIRYVDEVRHPTYAAERELQVVYLQLRQTRAGWVIESPGWTLEPNKLLQRCQEGGFRRGVCTDLGDETPLRVRELVQHALGRG